MQALPASNPVTPAVPANVANPPSAEGAAAAAVPDGSEPATPATFEQVLASQLDAETLKASLSLEAVNADWDDDGASGDIALATQDPALALQLPQPAVAPVANPANDALGATDLSLDAESALSISANGGTREPVVRDDATEGGLREIADLAKSVSGKGIESESGMRATAPLESGAQSQPLHGTPEAQRSHTAVRSPDGPAFNPRAIPEPVKSPQWSEALGQRVVWMSKENVQVVYLQVEPPNLGPLEVQLRLSNDQANLTFSSAHASVRDAISGSLPKLDELLAAGGVSLGSVSVNTQSPSQDPRQRQSGDGAQAQPASWEIDPDTGEASRPVRPLVIGLVDTFA